MWVLLLSILLPFQGQAILPFTQVATWFDTFIAPYESIGKFDAFGFSYFTANSSSFHTAVKGRCYSLTGTDRGIPDPAVSLFRIGSVTKLYTATAILQLYERGLLDLNASVVTYVPSLSSVITKEMKVIHTLSHTVGVDERMLNIYISGSSGIKESLAKASRVLWTQQLVPPGSRITYSNIGLTIMGAIVEGISQQTLSEYFQQNIVKPLNLSVVKFHHDMNGDFTNVCYPRSALHYEPYQIRTTASGDLYTTLNDVTKFLTSHLKNGSALFQKPETAQLMHSRLYPTAFDGMAYTFQRHTFRNRTILAKDGGVFHFLCNAALYLEYNEGIFALSTVGLHPTGGFLEEQMMFQFVSDNYNTSIQPEFPFPVDSRAQLSPIQRVYVGSRGGQKSPLKLYYLLRNMYLSVADDSVTTAGVTYKAALNVPGLSSRQLLLMANTSTSPDRKNQFMLVTFTDSSRKTVSQIEQYPDFNTLQPLIDWRNNMLTVFILFGFGLLAQLLSALGFPIICVIVKCKRQPFTLFHLMGITLAIVSWMSIGFFASLAMTPYPRIFFDVQPGFIAIQALAIAMFVLILLEFLLMFVCWMRNDRHHHSWSETVNYDRIQTRKQWINPSFFSLKSVSKYFLGFWIVIAIFHIIGIVGYSALNLLSFNIW